MKAYRGFEVDLQDNPAIVEAPWTVGAGGLERELEQFDRRAVDRAPTTDADQVSASAAREGPSLWWRRRPTALIALLVACPPAAGKPRTSSVTLRADSIRFSTSRIVEAAESSSRAACACATQPSGPRRTHSARQTSVLLGLRHVSIRSTLVDGDGDRLPSAGTAGARIGSASIMKDEARYVSLHAGRRHAAWPADVLVASTIRRARVSRSLRGQPTSAGAQV